MRTPTRHVSAAGVVTFKVRFRLGGRQTSETFDTEPEAVKFCRLLEALGPAGAIKQLDDELLELESPTLDDLAADHVAHLTGVEAGTRLGYTRLWARTWSPLLGSVPAHALTRDAIATATNKLARHYSHKSLLNQRGLLAAVCDRAVELGYLSANPCKRLRLPRGKESERVDMRLLSQDEFVAIADAIDEHYRPLVRFLAGTGCRWGEAVALEVGDLALGGVRPEVRIRRALKWSPDNNRTVGPPKTARSNRTVVLPAELVQELEELVASRGRGELVFTAHRGGAVLHRTFWSRYWLPAIQAAEISEPRPRIHDLRHSHASWLLAAGVPIVVVQARLGHESITTTVDTYGHLQPDAQIAAANAAAVALPRGRRAIESG